METDALIDFIHRLLVLDHNYVMHRFTGALIEETTLYNPKQLRDVVKLIEEHRRMHREILASFSGSRRRQPGASMEGSRHYIKELEASLALRQQIVDHAAAVYHSLPHSLLSGSQKAHLDTVLDQWENERGVDLRRVRPRDSNRLVARIEAARGTDRSSGIPFYEPKKIPVFERLTAAVDKERQKANEAWGRKPRR